MSASGEDRISTFERHCGLLLRAYPAAYRSERGAEIIGTLLETTPEGRAWPLPRDIRGLAIGGLRARAALNRRNTTAANLRIAVLVGIAAYIASYTAGFLGFLIATTGQHRFGAVDWPQFLGTVLSTASALIVWISRHRAIVLIFALPAAAFLIDGGPWQVAGSAVTNLACLTGLIALCGGSERPGRGWLWPIGVIVLAEMLLPVAGGVQAAIWFACVLCLVFASIVLLAIDARPVIALVIFVLAQSLPATIDEVAGGTVSAAGTPGLAICGAVAALAIWRLRRQSAHPGRPTRI